MTKDDQNAMDDLAVSRAIISGRCRAMTIAHEAGFVGKEAHRRVDRSLRRLRRRGVIVYQDAIGWRPAK